MWWMMIFPIIVPIAVYATIRWKEENAQKITVNRLADRSRKTERKAFT